MSCGFSDVLGAAAEVEQVVRDLERHADIAAVLRHLCRIGRTHPTDEAAELTADLEEVRRLLADALVVGILPRGDLIDRMILQNLALAQRADQMRQLDVDGRVIALLSDELERARKDIVTAQDGNLVAPLRIRRLSTASRIRLVDHIVVYEGCRVDELERHSHGHRTRTVERGSAACCQQEERRTQPLAPRGDKVHPDICDERRLGDNRLLKRRLKCCKILLYDIKHVAFQRSTTYIRRRAERRFPSIVTQTNLFTF